MTIVDAAWFLFVIFQGVVLLWIVERAEDRR